MYKLIIADDEALIRAGLLYRNNWNEMGFEIVAALEDGSDVLEFLEKERADVILSDICMYSVSGLEVAKVVREKYPWMKVVLLSVYQEFDYAKEAIRCGVYDYLIKPIEYEKLREIFEKIRKELDYIRQIEILTLQFGEDEYDLLMQILKRLNVENMGKEQEKWRSYEKMRYVICDSSSKMKELLVKELLDLLYDKLQCIDIVLAQTFLQKLQEVYDCEYDKEQGMTLFECLTWLNKQLVLQKVIVGSSNHDDLIIKACMYIRMHLGDALTLESVAEQFHLSARHFSRRFTIEMGEGFHTYLHRIRMEEAMRLLKEGKVKIAEVNEAVGYEDEKYFRKLFKKYTGYTAREFGREND